MKQKTKKLNEDGDDSVGDARDNNENEIESMPTMIAITTRLRRKMRKHVNNGKYGTQ